jgi:hypothetical protein
MRHYMAANRKLGLDAQMFEFINTGLHPWIFHGKKWAEVNLKGCLQTLLSLCRQEMVRYSLISIFKADSSRQSPALNETLVNHSLELVRSSDIFLGANPLIKFKRLCVTSTQIESRC